jgi:hypothetical protein
MSASTVPRTERRLFAQAREDYRLLSVMGFAVSLPPRLAGFAAAD